MTALVDVDAFWRAANFLSVGQIYLLDNPLLGRPLGHGDIKPRLLGHWGTTPGLNFVYAHVNRLVRERDLDAVVVMGPGHGGPAGNACAWLDGTYSEAFPAVSADAEGMQRLFRQFSFPGGVPSHCSPHVPGSMHEGGELGYSLMHAHGAALDNPGLTVFCVIGDGEAETGPLAASWQLPRLGAPVHDGDVVPILALNGYKIANPTVLARIPETRLTDLLRGYGYAPRFVRADLDSSHEQAHQAMAQALDSCLDDLKQIRQDAGAGDGAPTTALLPMVVLRTPKGWTGPRVVDGQQVEGTFRAHQVPLPGPRTDPAHLAQLEAWMRSYRPEELFDPGGRPTPIVCGNVPTRERRVSANPVTNGGQQLELDLPDWREVAVDVTNPGAEEHSATTVLGDWLAQVADRNRDRFLLVGPDEIVSNRLGAVLDATGGRRWNAIRADSDDRLSAEGRSIEVLSEHLCQGLLEGYVLSGRHGVFTCYEAFVHIVDSMFNQHAKWLEQAAPIDWRSSLPSLNYLLSSHVWRQDHNGATHQDPGFLDVVLNKKPHLVRVYLPPDANTLLSTYDHCLRSRDYVNVVVAGKQLQLSYLDRDAAARHCARGLGVWAWAGREDAGREPDVVLACAGDVPTMEALAASELLQGLLPDLQLRVVNVVDLMRLQTDREHPHGLSEQDFQAVFPPDRPVIFAFHGYPATVHKLTSERRNRFHVRGFHEEGTTTTPFDMVMLNDIDRFHLAIDVIDNVPGLALTAASTRQQLLDQRARAKAWTTQHGVDLPEIEDWRWPTRP